MRVSWAPVRPSSGSRRNVVEHQGTLVAIMKSLSAIFEPYLVSLGAFRGVEH